MKIKNKIAIIFLLTFIIRQLLTDHLKINMTIKNLLENWRKTREKGQELFYKPSTAYKRMWGDCDDFVTVMSAKLKQLNIKFKIGFLIRDNGAYHVFVVTNKNILLDPWISRRPIQFKRSLYKNADNIVLYDINFKEELL